MRDAELLIAPRWMIPIEPAAVTLEDHALVVDGGRIAAIGPAAELRREWRAGEELTLQDHVLLPGFVNLHTHAAMTLLRGYADDLALMDWLRERIWPAELRHAGADFVHDGTLLACAEMLRGGVTCFNDMYFHPASAAEAALKAGIRAVLGIIVVEFPTAYAADPDDYLRKGLATRDALRGHSSISFCIAPHAPYTVSDRSFARIAVLAEQLEVPIHLHLHETQAEIDESVARFGVRPIERLRRLGLLGPQLIAVHAVHLEAGEIDELAAQGASIAHCPTSNMKLASGVAPVAQALRRGVQIGLGTDGAASNNRLDILREMRHAALLAKAASGDATALGAHAVLRMATLAGAAALGLAERIGSLEVGKEADLCAVDLSDPLLRPCYDPASHLVYVAGRDSVTHVWVQGQPRVSNGVLLQTHNKELLSAIQLWENQLKSQ